MRRHYSKWCNLAGVISGCTNAKVSLFKMERYKGVYILSSSRKSHHWDSVSWYNNANRLFGRGAVPRDIMNRNALVQD